MKRWIIFLCLFGVMLSVSSIKTTTLAQANPCEKTPTARLKAGTQARIVKPTSKDILGAFLKPQPDHITAVLHYLPIGTVVNVTDGPTCGSDGLYWYKVTLDKLEGYIAETSGKNYVMEPFTGTAPVPLPTTLTEVMACIGANSAPAATESAAPSGKAATRVVYATADGNVLVSDHGAVGRVLTKFDPAPLAVDLAPDGSAALVATYNGLYWVDASNGTTLFVADAQKFGLPENAWIDAVTWLPSQNGAAVEIVEQDDTITSYAVWAVPLDGSYPPYRVDSGAQAVGGIIRSPKQDHVVVLSTNDISPFPTSASQDTNSLLNYVPRIGEGENGLPVMPTLSWDSDEKGFYTYIPISDQAPQEDTVGGHLWYVALDGQAKDLGKPAKLNPIDYVIASGDGQFLLVSRSSNWTIRNVTSGATVQTLPSAQLVFGWTPDSKGILYRTQSGEAKYLGTDGGTSSPYVPSLTGLADIQWLPDGTPVYVAQGKDKKLSLSLRPNGADPVFLGIIANFNTFSGRILPEKPAQAVPPSACK
ncbi:MAG: hypothetical protein ABI947_23670 [Chloroflexota bacterium]